MEKQKPLVTLRINSYNHEKYLRESIMAAVSQTYDNIEIIAVDDGSTDGSHLILSQLSVKYEFKYIRQENKGLSATINDILQNHMKGKYIIGTSSDDILMPDVVEKYVAFMEGNPEIGMCYGNAYKIDSNSEIVGEIIGSQRKGWLLEDIALGKCKIPLMALMWRSNIFEKIGYYDSKIISEDTYMLFKVAKNYQIGNVNTFGKKYRVHETNTSSNVWQMYQSSIKVIEMYKNESFYSKMLIDKHTKLFYLLSYKYKKEALKFFPNAMKKFYTFYFYLGVLRLLGIDIQGILRR